MRGAILCNGPSRKLYNPGGYDYVIGCNVPWTNVDATVIIDIDMVKHLANNPELIKYKIYFGRDAWRYTDGINKRKHFLNYLHEIVDPKPPFYSCGHMALQILLNEGYNEIDIYGCDSRFTKTLESYTHQYTDSSNNDLEKCINAWNVRWDNMIKNNPNANINFIRDTSEDIHTA